MPLRKLTALDSAFLLEKTGKLPRKGDTLQQRRYTPRHVPCLWNRPMTAPNVTVHSYDGMLHCDRIPAQRTIPQLEDQRLSPEKACDDLNRAAARPDAR